MVFHPQERWSMDFSLREMRSQWRVMSTEVKADMFLKVTLCVFC
jgi:hypothetical protein